MVDRLPVRTAEAQLRREIKEQGFRACQSTIRHWRARRRGPAGRPGKRFASATGAQSSSDHPAAVYPDSPRSCEQPSGCELRLRRLPDLARVVAPASPVREFCRPRSPKERASRRAGAGQTGWRLFAVNATSQPSRPLSVCPGATVRSKHKHTGSTG